MNHFEMIYRDRDGRKRRGKIQKADVVNVLTYVLLKNNSRRTQVTYGKQKKTFTYEGLIPNFPFYRKDQHTRTPCTILGERTKAGRGCHPHLTQPFRMNVMKNVSRNYSSNPKL